MQLYILKTMRSREFSRPQRDIVVIMHNIRAVYNVGAILRTADCLGVSKVYATGYTPNLTTASDGSSQPILPHIKLKLQRELHRSALGAETTVPFIAAPDINALLARLKSDGYTITALEQAERAINLADYQAPAKTALLLGEEVRGITPELLAECPVVLELPMFGQKESYNVSVATGIALYSLTCL